MQLIVGLGLGAAVVASLALPGKFVIAEQPAMEQLAVPRPPRSVVVEAAPIPRTPVRPAPSRQLALPAQPATAAPSPVARRSSVARTRLSSNRPAHRARPSQPDSPADEPLSELGTGSSEPEETRKHVKPKSRKP